MERVEATWKTKEKHIEWEENDMKIRKKLKDIKEKLQGIDNHLSLNWKHILGDNACIRKSSRGIKIELRKKKEGNRRKDKEKGLEVPLETFRIEE